MFQINLIVLGDPLTQKNDLIIKKQKLKSGKMRSFVGHSSKFGAFRDKACLVMYEQYQAQGYKVSIDFLIEANMVFYVKRWHEPDLDNLPACYLDGMLGVRPKGAPRGTRVAQVLKDDKLVRKLIAEKIVEGDPDYAGEPRAEITIRRYNPS